MVQLGVGLVIGLVVLVIVASIGGQILSTIQGTQTADTTEYNITADGLSGISSFGDLTPVMFIVGAAAVILGLLMLFGRFRM